MDRKPLIQLPPTPSELMAHGYSFNEAHAVRRPPVSVTPTLDAFEARCRTTSVRALRFNTRGDIIIFR